MILYNSFKFYETAVASSTLTRDRVSKWMETDLTSPPAGGFGGARHVLDRWILARLNETIRDATNNLEKYEIGAAARAIEVLVDDLSRWYIRRSRKRLEMQETLGVVLLEISKMIAPFTPFFGEMLYLSTARVEGLGGLKSVHLEDWPKVDVSLIDEGLLQKMKKVRELAALALAERAAAGIKVRQPLAALKIKVGEFKNESELLGVLKDEVNVKEIIFDEAIEKEVELDTDITAELKEEGLVKELVRLVQNLRREAGLMPQNKISLCIHAPGMAEMLQRHSKVLGEEVGASQVEFKRTEKFDAEISTRIEGQEVWIGIRRT